MDIFFVEDNLNFWNLILNIISIFNIILTLYIYVQQKTYFLWIRNIYNLFLKKLKKENYLLCMVSQIYGLSWTGRTD